MNPLKRRIIDISYQQGLSHIGSCLTAVDIIDEIYKIKKPDEKFILSSGHAHLAHLVVREKYEGIKIGKIHDIHCNDEDGCDVPTGSLGQGLPIALGMALADRSKNVYCLISDGEFAEGSIHEALRIKNDYAVGNLKIYLNYNGYGAYRHTNLFDMTTYGIKIYITHPTELDPYLKDPQEAHYKVLKKEEYEAIINA